MEAAKHLAMHRTASLQRIQSSVPRGQWHRASLVAQMLKSLPAMWETRVQSPGREDPLKWQPTPVSLSGKCHGWRNLAGWCPWGCKELDTTEQLTYTQRSEALSRAFGLLGWHYNLLSQPSFVFFFSSGWIVKGKTNGHEAQHFSSNLQQKSLLQALFFFWITLK